MPLNYDHSIFQPNESPAEARTAQAITQLTQGASSMLTPPTDNLYKFMAIFGLVMIVTGFLLGAQAQRDLDDALTGSLVETARFGEFRRMQGQAMLDLARQMQRYDAKTETGAQEQLKILDQMQRVQSQDKTWDEIERSPSYVKAHRRYEFAKQAYIATGYAVLVLVIVGAVLSLVGFRLWYVRVQVFADAALRATETSDGKHAADRA